MKTIVIGATGHVGQLTVASLLKAGHEVTAFGRSIEKITRRDPRLTIVKGDVMKADDVTGVVPGHDAVLLTFGAPLTRENFLHEPDLCRVGTANVIAAMSKSGVRRLIAMTSLGAGDSAGHGSFMFRTIIKPVLLGRIMKDRTAQEELIRASDVPEWVIVRPTELADGDEKPVRLIEDLDHGLEPTTVTRASVGSTLAALMTDKRYDRRAIVMTN